MRWRSTAGPSSRTASLDCCAVAVASKLPRLRRGRARPVLPALRRRIAVIPLPVALLAAAALAQGIGWAVATAPVNGPDEQAHAAYAQYVAETGNGPFKNVGNGTVSSELGVALYELNLAPILGHLDGRPTWTRLDAVSDEIERLPDAARENGSGPNSAAGNPPLYYVYAAVAYKLSPDQSLLGRLFAMRVATVLMFPLMVVLSWLIAAELFAGALPRLLTAGLVALHPKLGSEAGVINPDMLLFLIATAFLLVALRLVRHGFTWGRVLGIGLLAGASAATHGRGLALVPPALLALAIAWWRFRPAPRPGLLKALAAGAIMLLCAVLVLRYTRNHAGGLAFGGQTQGGASGFNIREFASYVWQFYLPKMTFMDPMLGPPYGYRQAWIDSHFGMFAALEVNYAHATYDKIQIAAGAGLLALWTTIVVRRRQLLAAWPAVAVCAGTFVSLLLVLHVAAYRALQQAPDPVFTGRYLLPCVALYGAAIAWVVTSLPRRVGPFAAAILLAASALLSIGGIGLTALRFYA
jgi:hypothetical protein